MKEVRLSKKHKYLGDHENNSVLREICHIKLAKLTLINFGGNDIESVEALWLMDVPLLQKIYICT